MAIPFKSSTTPGYSHPWQSYTSLDELSYPAAHPQQPPKLSRCTPKLSCHARFGGLLTSSGYYTFDSPQNGAVVLDLGCQSPLATTPQQSPKWSGSAQFRGLSTSSGYHTLNNPWNPAWQLDFGSIQTHLASTTIDNPPKLSHCAQFQGLLTSSNFHHPSPPLKFGCHAWFWGLSTSSGFHPWNWAIIVDFESFRALASIPTPRNQVVVQCPRSGPGQVQANFADCRPEPQGPVH